MVKYIFKRLLTLIPVLLVVSVTIFLLIHLVPGDPAAAMLGEQATQEQIDALRETLGLNKPLIVQYLRWVRGLFHGDWGRSLFMEGTMLEIIGSHMIPTLQQTLVAVSFAALIGVPLGMLRQRHDTKFAPHAMRGDNSANHDLLFHRITL